jgi:hypothetical protein
MMRMHHCGEVREFSIHWNRHRLGRHHVAHFDPLWIFIVPRDIERDIAISEDSAQLAVFDSDDAANAFVAQEFTGGEDVVLR